MEQEEIVTERIEVIPSVGERTQKIDSLEIELSLYKRRYNLVLQAALALVGVVLIVTILIYIWPDISRLFDRSIKPTVLRFWPYVAGIVVVFVLGFNLYAFRGFRRRYYGIGEVLFGLVLGVYAINQGMFVSVTGGVFLFIPASYMVARGLNNIYSFPES